MKIHIGDTVLYTTFSGHMGAAQIESIEVTHSNEKYGNKVDSTNTNEDTSGTVCLSDGHWCYFTQLIKVLSYKNYD